MPNRVFRFLTRHLARLGGVAAILSLRAAHALAAQEQANPAYDDALGNGVLGWLLQGRDFVSPTALDVVVLAVAAFVAYKFWTGLNPDKSQNQQGRQDRSKASDRKVEPREASEAYRRAQAQWEHLRGRPKPPPATENSTDDAEPVHLVEGLVGLPPGFDARDFLKGAKIFYNRFKESWSQRDLDDLAQFTAPDMHRRLQERAQANPQPTQIAILTLNARILDVKQEAGHTTVQVAYDVLLSENPSTEEPRQVREIWRFGREDSRRGSWLLEAMEQLH